MVLGFFLAWRLPVWASVAVDRRRSRWSSAISIRDNLTLNVIMLFYPIEAIRDWQAGG